MFKRKKDDINAFGQPEVEQIIDELQSDDVEMVRALLSLRQEPGAALHRRLKEVTGMEQNQQSERAGRMGRPMLMPRLALRAAAFAAVFVLAAVLLLATVPSVRAAIGRFFEQRFGLVVVEPAALTVPAVAEPDEDREVQVVEEVIPPRTFEEIQAQTPFRIPLPALVPDGLELWAARMSEYGAGESGGSNGEQEVVVVLTYKPTAASAYDPSAALSLQVHNRTGVEGGYAVTASAEESVTVNGAPAVYARGVWERPDENEPLDPANMIWDADADAAMLSWEADGFTYTLTGYLLELSREDYVRIAESVR